MWEYHQWSVPYTKMRCVWIRLGMARCMVAVRKHSRPGSNSYVWPLRHAHLSPMRQLNCRGVYSVQLECTFTWRRGGYSDTKHILCSCQTQLSSIKRYDLSRNTGPMPHISAGMCLGGAYGDPLWEYHQWSVPYTKIRRGRIRADMATQMPHAWFWHTRAH